MKKAELYRRVLDYVSQKAPSIDSELHFDNPYQLLVSVVLSAQCTDKRVNQVTPALFARFPSPEAMARASEPEVLPYISSVSYPNSKARYLVEGARMIVERFGGLVPKEADDLEKIPGVGRKTANVVRAIAFGQNTLAVDTHVFRVSHRLGLVGARCTTPLSVEKELMRHIPIDLVSRAHFWLLYFGRYTCLSRNPKCQICGLTDVCREYRTRLAQQSNK